MNTFEQTINYIRDILRKNGITSMDSIKHCIAFMVGRYLTNEKCQRYGLNPTYSFENIDKDENGIPFDDDNLFMEKFYNKRIDCFIGQLRQKFNFKFDFNVTNVKHLKTILNKLGELNIDELDLHFDIIGTIYEMHLKTGTGTAMRDLGQYYSNRHIINFMIQLTQPKLKSTGQIESILDPSCGTGGFLSMSIRYLNSKYKNIDWTSNKNNIHGFDIDENNRNMTLLNMLLETGQLFNQTIHKQDTLKNDITNPDTNVTLNGADIILANEPFGLKNLIHAECCNKVKNLKIRGTKGEPLFIQLMMESLNIGGRCAVIVPEGVLFNDSTIHKGTRKHLIDNYNLKKIVYMNDSFFMNTDVKCAILYFSNETNKTSKLEYTEIKFINGAVQENSLLMVNVDDIKKNDYYLGFNKYVKSEKKQINGLVYKKLGDVCEFISGKRRNASDAMTNGKYKFITCSVQNYFYLDDYDFEDMALILNSINGSGKCMIYCAEKYSTTNNNIHFKPIDKNTLLTKYIYYYLHKNIHILEEGFIGSNQKKISISYIKELQIPIPSLEIQHEIVNQLDIIYDQIETLKKSIKNFESIKKSVVYNNTINCEIKKLGELCEFKSGKFNSKDSLKSGLYPFYSSEANNPTKFMNEYCFDNENYIILIKDGGAGKGKYGDQIGLGKVFYVTGKSASTSHQLALYPKSNNCKYLYYYLQYIKNDIMDLAQYTTGLGTIKKSIIEDINIPLPPLNVQQDIVFLCDHYDIMIEALTKEIQLLESNDVINKLLESIKINDDENEVEVLTSNIDEVVITIGHNDKPKKKTVKQAIEM
jgi:type I restriction-modification system DNA methylase subunit